MDCIIFTNKYKDVRVYNTYTRNTLEKHKTVSSILKIQMNRHIFIKENLVSLFFNATRKSTRQQYTELEDTLIHLLKYIRALIVEGVDDFDDPEYGFYLQTICRMIVYTRTVKGERDISYCMLYILYLVYPEKALELLNQFVEHSDSWIDMKRMAEYVFSIQNQDTTHPIIRRCVELLNRQLFMDNRQSAKRATGGTISSVSVWIPRENSANAWLFHELAYDWATRHTPYYFTSAKTDEQRQRAVTKSRTEYRILVSRLSKICVQKKKERSLSGFVREATRLLVSPNIQDTKTTSDKTTLEIIELNEEWDAMIQTYGDINIGKVLPVLDISLSMTENGESALCKAIGVACFLLEKTTLEKRIMTIDQTPSWIVMDHPLPFVSMVEMIREVVSRHGRTTKQLFRSIDVLAQSFASVQGDDHGMVSLVILSDMRFANADDTKFYDTTPPDFPVDESIRSCFGMKQIQHLNRNIPHITYWNVGETYVGLPCDYDRLGGTVISGASPNCARCILPDWHYDFLHNPCEMLANTPFDAMCSVLSSCGRSISV